MTSPVRTSTTSFAAKRLRVTKASSARGAKKRTFPSIWAPVTCVPTRATGKSEEEAARDLRYAFLRETAQMLGAQIALAHHADDNAETVLLNFVRGTDLRGLCGMRPKQGDIVRPFLEQTREELVTYARAHNIPHVEDHTNADPNAAARNYLRLEILPRLRSSIPARLSISPQRRVH